jgi:alkylation response protein AidB-like acyl-CoA dehydrogenase
LSRSDDVTFDATPAVAAILDARPDTSLMAWNSLGLSSLYLGVAATARDWLVKFLSERTPASLGAPLATLPRFQQAVGEIESALGSASDLVDAVVRWNGTTATCSARACTPRWMTRSRSPRAGPLVAGGTLVTSIDKGVR